VNPDGTMVAQVGLPPVSMKNHIINILTTLTISGLLVWALASIYVLTVQPGWDAYISYSNTPLPVGQSTGVTCNGGDNNGDDVFSCGAQQSYYSYLYTVAYPVIVALAFASWIAGEVSQNAYKSNWISFRSHLFGLTALCFYFFAPILIYVARTVNSADLNSANLAIAAGVFILTGSSFLWMLSSIWHYFSLPIPVPDRTVTVMTKDVQLNSVAVDPVNKVGEAARAAAIGSGNMYTTDPAASYPAGTYPTEGAATYGDHRDHSSVELH